MKGCGPIFIEGNKWKFSVWAPELATMSLHIISPSQAMYPMQKDEEGYFTVECDGISENTYYFYQPDDDVDVPDPASHFQPNGVHGCSAVVDHRSFKWHDETWRGRALRDLIIYELHIGTFTDTGTFESAIQQLDDLVDLGINAIEIMPVAQFPGKRNWGYDGVFPYAVQNSYGGPDGLKMLVDACHQKGIAVILDVVYNHMGPEGNYFNKFGPWFTKAYHVPWGDAINFDQQWSDGVREYFLNNIEHWITNYHIDGLRLDAIHTIFDVGADHILAAFNRRADKLREKAGRNIFLIAESDLNDPRILSEYKFDAQWLDDFHHSLYVIVHPDGKKQYEDFGSTHQLAKAFKDGFVSSGGFVKFRKKKYGASSAGIEGDKFVVFIQNHDQVGNRVLGERISSLIGTRELMVAAAAMILSPYIPMLFMGEEYAEDAPFMYFVDHSDKELIKAVREGRKKEFAHMGEHEPKDAQDEKTFLECKLNWNSRGQGKHGKMLQWYMDLIRLRKSLPAFEKRLIQVSVIAPKCISIYHEEGWYLFFNLSSLEVSYSFEDGNWQQIFGNEESSPGKIKPWSVAVYKML
ncbi:MAG TPA: malto-oligosyltrehalose trehalohydrolase [Cyclobacteriaceae bacterium]|nr:malto-oligosyltrehalose trehalohydrolase [Cyclobacteriaceae bacterium]